ncbi:DUF4410 domain-containing protein [Pseudoxanthomonas sangjuensis]|uniref:DUF4410 domain-containing protein n=1 Tax=Pseudoxanthomonas sangjuensis TaxID=1503750 RepID=UPI0013913A3A|nr:DUF4410 domain-containing protein [Pseudoxanthomonas sangjuensis]
MKRALSLVGLAVLLCTLLTGCIGTSSSIARPNSAEPGSRLWYTIENPGGMTPQGLQVLRARLDERFAGVLVPENSQEAVRVKITVTRYYMRPGAARALVGIMAGKDRVLSTVQVLDPVTGEELGRLNVESGNATAVGSAGGLLRGHADEIADFVLAGGALDAPKGDPTMPAAEQAPQPGQMK